MPYEEDLAAVVGFQLAHIALGDEVDTRFAFNDRLLFPDQSTLQRLNMNHTEAQNEAAARKAVEIFKASVYQDKIANVGLFYEQLAATQQSLSALLTPRLGDSLLRPDGHAWLADLANGAPALQADNLQQNRCLIELSLGSEKQIYDPTMRGQLMLTTDNYEISVEPARSSIGTQECVVLDVKARKASLYLINGKAWVDAKTYLLVRVQGTQSRSLLWAGTPLITRDFTNVNGFAMVIHEKIEAHNFILGQTVEEVEYKDYKVVGDARSADQ